MKQYRLFVDRLVRPTAIDTEKISDHDQALIEDVLNEYSNEGYALDMVIPVESGFALFVMVREVEEQANGTSEGH